jgi:hypothetical protein
MNLAFFELDPMDPADAGEFLDSNAHAHQSVHNALLGLGLSTPQYCLNYAAVDHDFMMLNAAELRAWGSSLGISPPTDLDTVDPQDKGAMRDWVNNQYLFLSQVTQALNI